MTSPPVGRYLVLCEVDRQAAPALADHRAAHLAHVAAHQDRVAFGGTWGDPDGPPAGICYVLDVPTEEAARRFVETDPYFPSYAAVRIDAFVQRLPVPSGGRLG